MVENREKPNHRPSGGFDSSHLAKENNTKHQAGMTIHSADRQSRRLAETNAKWVGDPGYRGVAWVSIVLSIVRNGHRRSPTQGGNAQSNYPLGAQNPVKEKTGPLPRQ